MPGSTERDSDPLDLDYLGLDLPAGGGLVGDGVAGAVPHKGLTQWGVGGEDLDSVGHVLGDLLAAQGEDLLFAGHLRGDDRAGRDRAVVGRLADLGVLQGLLELDDARLIEPRLLAGRVIAGVLPQVTLLAGRFNALGDLLALGRLAVLELGGQAVVGLLCELATTTPGGSSWGQPGLEGESTPLSGGTLNSWREVLKC